MVRGLYISAAGALVAQAAIDNTANNLANVDTTGFKRTLLQVQSQPMTQLYRIQTDAGRTPGARTPGVAAQVPIGQLGSGSQIYGTPTTFEQGPISNTGNGLDFAISGPGFFQLRTLDGTIAYTRDGNFIRDSTNHLVTPAGDQVLNAQGAPVILPTQGKIEVDRNGAINAGGAVSDTIGTFEFANVDSLQRVGTNKYTDLNQAQPAGARAATNTTVLQYSQERSNSDVVRSIVDLITNERWFDANEKSIQTQDDAVGQAISAVGITRQ